MLALRTDDDIRQELRFRTRWRGSSAEVARELHISRSHLLGIINGNARMGDDARQKILDAFRLEELCLADRIERELNQPSMLKEGE